MRIRELLAAMLALAAFGDVWTTTPNRRWIVFVSNSDGNRDGAWGLYIMDSDGKNAQKVADGLTGEEPPCWSPNGRSVLFVAKVNNQPDLFILTLGNGKRVQLTDDAHKEQDVYW